MYFKFQKAGNLLQVGENFARLVNISEHNEYEFEFDYNISQREAIQRAATKVRITVEAQQFAPTLVFDDSDQNKALKILTAVRRAKLASVSHKKNVLANRISDITAYVNNDIVTQLTKKVNTSQITALNRPTLKIVKADSIKASNDALPLLHRISNSFIVPNIKHAISASADENPKHLMLDMITRQGIDPSHITKLTSRSSSEYETKGGLLNQQGANESITDPATRLLNHYLFPPEGKLLPTTTDQLFDSEYVTILQNLSSDYITIPVRVVISKESLEQQQTASSSTVFVKFELLEAKSNLAIDTVVKELNITKHVRMYHTPKIAPLVSAAVSDSSTRVNLEIKQVDPGATEVLIFKKSIWNSNPDVENYTLIGTYDLKSTDQSLLVQVDQPKHSPVVYRVIPRGLQSMLGFEYSNVVITPSRFMQQRAIALTCEQTPSGIKVSIRKIPPKVIAVQFLRLNTSFFESDYSVVNDEILHISDDVRRFDMLSVVDSGALPGSTYKYAARLIYKNGDQQLAGMAILEFVKPAPGNVDIKIENLVVDHDSGVPNVTFSINTKTIDTDIDAVKRMLTQQGLISYFSNDIQTQRDQLQQLIAHNVTRIDLSTGAIDYFGVITDPNFDDDALRKNQAIGELQYGHQYRYEIYPLLRAPETMFDQFVKESIDVVTQKTYTWKPSKYLHPLALTHGVLVTSDGAKKRYGKDPMIYGIVGAPQYVNVTFDEDTARIVDASVSVFDNQTNVVSWRILGNPRRIDHFMIFKEVHGIRTLLGKAHGEFEYGSCQYLHNVKKPDSGALKYVIIPIMNDYKVGASVYTNTIIVESSL